MKRASRRRFQRIGKRGAQLRVRDAEVRLWGQHGLKQGLRVRMPRLGKQGLRVCFFHDSAQVHDRNPCGDVFDHGQVVADDDVGQAEFRAQVQQQVEDLRLHRNIQRRGRLIADHHVRAHDQRTGDGDPLTLPSGKLAGVAGRQTTRKPHQFHHLLNPPVPFVPGAETMNPERQGNDGLDGFARVQRRERILKNRLHLLGQLLLIKPGHGLAVQQNVSAAGGFQAEQHAGQSAFSTARLAHQSQHAARLHGERDPIDRLKRLLPLEKPPADAEGFDDALGLKDRRTHAPPKATGAMGGLRVLRSVGSKQR